MLNRSTTSIANERNKENERFEKSIKLAQNCGIKFDKENKIIFEADEENDEERNEFVLVKEDKGFEYEGNFVLYRNGEEEQRFFSKKNALGFIAKYYMPHKLWISKLEKK